MKKLFLLFLALPLLVPVFAQIRGKNIEVMITPDRKDWTYRKGETATFNVSILKSGTLLDDAVVDYEAGPEMYPEIKKQAVRLNDGRLTLKGQMKKAGFYRVKVTAHVGGNDYEGICAVAFSPEELQPSATVPGDFDSFWQNTMAGARAIDLDPTCELLPERCTKEVNVYHVSFQNIRLGSRTYGILCIPVKEGKYPALLRVPGAGVRPYQGDVFTASKGAITLEIGIHGVPVVLQQGIYDRLANGALWCYWNNNTDSRDNNYYRRVIVGAVRAIDYIASLPQWNGTSLGVTGSSQGGFLALACAGLDKRVTFYGAVHAALCDHTASLKKTACGWPHYFYGQENPDRRKVETSRYYDGVNFARRITCPGWFSFGYNDDVVPPTTTYATYNIVSAPKTLSVYPQTGHYWYQEQWDEWEDWLLKQMNIYKR